MKKHNEIHANESVFFIPAVKDDENRQSIETNWISYCQRFSGLFYALLASFMFTGTNFLMKRLDVFLLDVFLVRFVFQGFLSLFYIIYKHYRLIVDEHYCLLLIRSIFAALGSVCFYLALIRLPLSDLTTLRYTQIVWTPIISWIVFRERIHRITLFASALTLIGIVLVTQPSFSLSLENQRVFGFVFALLCALSVSTAIVLGKKLLDLKVRQSIIMFYFILTTFLMLLIIQTIYWTKQNDENQKFNFVKLYYRKEFFYATILATLQMIPMILTQKSIKREHPSIVTVAQTSDILFALVLENLFSNNKTNLLALIGSMLVLISIFMIGIHKLWLDRRQRKHLPTSTVCNLQQIR